MCNFQPEEPKATGMTPKNAEADKSERRKPGRVPTACAECRRLKMRCDRRVPCETCIKRGCSAICPHGSLTPGKGNRLILANTGELHEKIDQLGARVRDLEGALRSLQATHPLLQNEISVAVQPPTSKDNKSRSVSAPVQEAMEENLVDAFGTLSIGEGGETVYFGRTARVEFLVRAASAPPRPVHRASSRCSERIRKVIATFDVDRHIDESLVRDILEVLPPLSDAVHLCNTYLNQGKHGYNPICRSQLFDELIVHVYQPQSLTHFQFHHAVSLLYIILAIACLVDPSRPQSIMEAQMYYDLCRVSLTLSPPVREVTLYAVQTLVHLTQYLQLCDVETAAPSKSWLALGCAVALGMSIGLHLNSARWTLDRTTSERRHKLFWDLCTLDTLLSFSFGRPPSIIPSCIDCPLPRIDALVDDDNQQWVEFSTWVWQYTRLMHNIMTTAFGARSPSYSRILDLDRKVREFPVPACVLPACNEDNASPSDVSSDVYMQRWWVLSFKEATLLHLHRSFLVDALSDQPQELLKHKYAPSVAAAYRSAYRLIQGLKSIAWQNVPHVISRIPETWSRAGSSAVVMCLLATRAPSSSLAPSAIEQLNTVADLFVKAAPTCHTAAVSLDWIQRLCSKANQAMDRRCMDSPLTPTELDRLGGKTHLITGSTSIAPAYISGSASHLAGSPVMVSNSLENLHPTIINDMRTFENVGTDPPAALSSIWDTPLEAYPDVPYPEQGLFGVEPFSHHISSGGVQGGHASLTRPAVLDAGWQSFLEHLGFSS